jgi:5,10-methylenetetrahydrofolate reductase
VIRPLVNSNDPAVIEVSLRKAKKVGRENILLGPGDIVWVEQTSGTVFMEALQLIRFGVSGSAPLF